VSMLSRARQRSHPIAWARILATASKSSGVPNRRVHQDSVGEVDRETRWRTTGAVGRPSSRIASDGILAKDTVQPVAEQRNRSLLSGVEYTDTLNE
jgi:hypothetical protein